MTVVEFTESPRTFHARDIPDVPQPAVWWNHLTESALVLGSTQRDDSIVDTDAVEAGGLDVVRRRSGGGAVLLIADDVVWFDVIVPTGSVPELSSDIHAPMLWLGDRLVDALRPHVDGELSMHGPGMVETPWSSLVCFDGFGPGEVLLDGRKLVGISQRRTRAASRLQCCWYRRTDPAALVELVRPLVGVDPADLSPVATFEADDDTVRTVLGAILTESHRQH